MLGSRSSFSWLEELLARNGEGHRTYIRHVRLLSDLYYPIGDNLPDIPPSIPRPAPAGNALIPQRQEQSQAPPLTRVPEPCAMLAALEEEAGGGTAAEVATAATEELAATATEELAATATEELAAILESIEPVPLMDIAAAWKAAWDLSAVGLILKTIPFPQWPVWRQYIQTGSVDVTWNIIIGGGLTVLSALGMKPESTPPSMATQGSLKEDCVTVWFLDMKLNWTISPGAAWMVSGV